MIRSNVGNIVTNGQQIMSVGAFTAGGLKRSLGRADTALNNLSKEERQNYSKMKADKMRDEINAYNSKSSNVESVDEIMGATSSDNNTAPLVLKENSEQVPYVNTNTSNNYKWLQDTRIMRGEDSNADV